MSIGKKRAGQFDQYTASSANPSPKSGSKHAGTLIKIIKFNDSKHLCKVVRATDGEPLENDVDVIGEVKQNIPFEKEAAKTLKTTTTPDGPIVEVNDHQASIRGSTKNGFFSYNEFGNFVKGPLSITAAPHEVRVAGITTLNPLLSSCFPSTIVTPIPTLVWSLPGAGALLPMAKDIAVMATLVGALGVSGAVG